MDTEGKDSEVVSPLFSTGSFFEGVAGDEGPTAIPLDVSVIEVPNKAVRVGVWDSTALAGLPQVTVCYYALHLVIDNTGSMAPVVLALHVVFLVLLRWVYQSSCNSLPSSPGGVYSLLFSISLHFSAVVAGAVSLLTFVGTAVVCILSAVRHAQYLAGNPGWMDGPLIPIAVATVLITAQAFLGVVGTARTALAIYAVHIGVALALMAAASITKADDRTLQENYESRPITGMGFLKGIGVGMVMVQGMEITANMVEHLDARTVSGTMRNIGVVSLVTPLLAFVTVCVLPLDIIGEGAPSTMLQLGKRVGAGMEAVVGLSGVCALCGSALCAVTGYNAQSRRMGCDGRLPMFMCARWASSAGVWTLAAGGVFLFYGDFATGVCTVCLLPGLVGIGYLCGTMALRSLHTRSPSVYTTGVSLPTLVTMTLFLVACIVGLSFVLPPKAPIVVAGAWGALIAVSIVTMAAKGRLTAFSKWSSLDIPRNATPRPSMQGLEYSFQVTTPRPSTPTPSSTSSFNHLDITLTLEKV